MNRIPLSCLSAALLLFLSACKGGGHEAREAHESAVDSQPATSLASGIATAQQSESGLQFLAAEIESEGGKVICSVLFAKGDAAREINVDATSGSIASAEDEKLEGRHRALLKELRKAPGTGSASAAQAIEAALKRAPGTWAQEIKLENEDGVLIYEVLLSGGKEGLVAHVSAADGSVKKLSEREEEEGDEAEEGEKDEGHESK